MTPCSTSIPEISHLTHRNCLKLIFYLSLCIKCIICYHQMHFQEDTEWFLKVQDPLLGQGPLNAFSYIIHIDLCLILRPFWSTFKEIQSDSHITLHRSIHAEKKNMKKWGVACNIRKNYLLENQFPIFTILQHWAQLWAVPVVSLSQIFKNSSKHICQCSQIDLLTSHFDIQYKIEPGFSTKVQF